MKKPLTHEQFLDRLRSQCTPTQAAFAHAHGVSETHLSEVLRNRRPPGQAILDALGLRRVTTHRYEPTRDAA